MAENNEYVPVVSVSGETLGRELRRNVHNGSKILHPVVHLHVINKSGNLLLQKRALTKLIQPGKWDTAVGGHVDYGETVHTALCREALEEIGLELSETPHEICRYVFESDVERELVYSFGVVIGDDVCLNPEAGEITDLRFWSESEIVDAISSGDKLTPNFISEYKNYVSEYISKIRE